MRRPYYRPLPQLEHRVEMAIPGGGKVIIERLHDPIFPDRWVGSERIVGAIGLTVRSKMIEGNYENARNFTSSAFLSWRRKGATIISINSWRKP